jgi:hypothetical protein
LAWKGVEIIQENKRKGKIIKKNIKNTLVEHSKSRASQRDDTERSDKGGAHTYHFDGNCS